MRVRALAVLMSVVGALAGPVATADANDPLVCPVLALMYPPDGDIPCVWDCPPYGAAPRSPRSSDDAPCDPLDQATPATLSIHRFPSTPENAVPSARLVQAPVGYACRDANTGAPVAEWDALFVPNPGVACDPITGSTRCVRVGASGYASTGIGAIAPTSACSTFAATHPMMIPEAPGGRTTASGEGTTTWWCTVAESPTVQLPITDYWVQCDINMA